MIEQSNILYYIMLIKDILYRIKQVRFALVLSQLLWCGVRRRFVFLDYTLETI